MFRLLPKEQKGVSKNYELSNLYAREGVKYNVRLFVVMYNASTKCERDVIAK